MSVKVYVLTDPILIDFAQNGDIEGFKEHLNSDDTIYFNDSEIFHTEAEALAYCAGIGYGKDERSPHRAFPTPQFRRRLSAVHRSHREILN